MTHRAEVSEIFLPRIHRIHIHQAGPVQRVDRQILVVIHSGQTCRQAGAVHVRFGTEGEPVKIHFELSIERATQRADIQIGNEKHALA